jgi:hypothetical protein
VFEQAGNIHGLADTPAADLENIKAFAGRVRTENVRGDDGGKPEHGTSQRGALEKLAAVETVLASVFIHDRVSDVSNCFTELIKIGSGSFNGKFF